MALIRSLFVLGFLIALVGSVDAAPGLKNGKKKKHHAVHGVVVAVHHKSAHHGSITIKPHQHHKKGTKGKAGMKAAAGQAKPAGQAAAGKAGAGAAGQAKAGGQVAAAKPAGQPKGAAAGQAGAGQGDMPQGGKHHIKTYHVTSSTKFEREVRVNGVSHHMPASFLDVHTGEHVAIHAHGHTAKKVTIHHHHKKKRPSSQRPGMIRKKNK